MGCSHSSETDPSSNRRPPLLFPAEQRKAKRIPLDIGQIPVELERIPLDIERIEKMLLEQPAVLDLLVATVAAAAARGDIKMLLPGCPVRDKHKLKAILTNLPPITKLRKSEDVTAAIQALGSPCNKFLSWLCESYGGRLVAAAGQLKIPDLPGHHQYVLVKAPSRLEHAFAARQRRSSGSMLLFHGTSIDRLHSILRNGLQVFSNTKLMKNGAALGNGIYMGANSMISVTFAEQDCEDPSYYGWHGSALGSVGVLLGCEYNGDPYHAQSGPGREVFIVRDPSTLILRYVWLVNEATFDSPYIDGALGSLPLGNRLEKYLDPQPPREKKKIAKTCQARLLRPIRSACTHDL
ncbi:MAG: hypothetical protein Q9218_004038 [Villophora microphyllina]